jgi:trimeric autotransporter adhesin
MVGCGRFGFDPLEARTTDSGSTGDGNTALRVAYIKPSNTEAFDSFGYSIALSADGNTLAVGAPQEDSGSPNQADNSVSGAGAVYIFVRSGTTWIQQAYLKASNPGVLDLFGEELALSADGNTLAVTAVLEDSATTGVNTTPDEAATDAGAAYVLTRTGTTWSQQAYLKASNIKAGDLFGESIAISASGDLVAVGASVQGGSGAAYVFARAGTTWTEQQFIKSSNPDAGDDFGNSIALSGDGSTLVVGAPGEDSGAPGINGNQIDNTVTEAGAAYVFVRTPTWTQQAYIKSSVPEFGDFFAKRISISADGNTLLCSGAGEDMIIANSGAAYVLSRSGATWSQAQKLKASNAGDNDQFGAEVAVSADASTLLVSAPFEDSAALGFGGDQLDDSAQDSGAGYAFTRGTSYTQAAYAKSVALGAGDQFSYALALSSDGRTSVCSCPYEDSAATGIDGDANDDSATDSGAVIVAY